MDLPAATRFSKKLAAAGFLSFGGFHPGKDDTVPETASGDPAQTVLMIGSAGPAFWDRFCASQEATGKTPDPMDRFTRRVLGDLAAEFGFTALFPSDGPPYHPFQRWTLRCGGFSQSPLGVLVNETYGPWAGLRAAFLSGHLFGQFEKLGTPGPCEGCLDKPCLSACPVNAISQDAGYDVPACKAYLRETPEADCWTGCRTRKACPYGGNCRQSSDNARFHMGSFTGLYAKRNK